MEPIQIIIISNDETYKSGLKNNLKHSNIDIYAIDSIADVLPYLDEKPPFKLIIFKPETPFEEDKIIKYSKIKRKEFNLRILVFQQKHKCLVTITNISIMFYLKHNIRHFRNMTAARILEIFEPKKNTLEYI